jgi:hypothetical protein
MSGWMGQALAAEQYGIIRREEGREGGREKK